MREDEPLTKSCLSLSLCVLRLQGAVTSVEFSPTGHLLASASTDNTVRLWEPTVRGKCSILKAHSAPVRSVSWSSDARLLITSSDDKTCKVWGSSGARFWCSLVGHTNWVRAAVLSRDTRLAASASDDKTVKLWDVHTHQCVQTFYDHSLPVRSVKFHPHGSVIASAGADNSIKLYDLRSQAMIQHYTAHDSVVNSIDFHPSGDYLLSGSDDSALKVWDLREGHQLYTIHGHKGATLGVTWSPEGDFFASAGADQRVMTWATNFDKVSNLAEPTLMARRKKVHIQPSSAEKQSREQYDAYEGQANPQFDLSGSAAHSSPPAPRTIHADALPGGYSTTTSLGAPSSAHGYNAVQGNVPQPAPHPEIELGHDCTYEHEHVRENGSSHAYGQQFHGHAHDGGHSHSHAGGSAAPAGRAGLTSFQTSYPLPADHAAQFLPPAGAPAVSLASDPRVTGPRLLAAAGAESASSGTVRMPDHVSAALNQIVTQLDVISRTVRAMEERLELHEQKMESLESRAIRRERNEAHMGVLQQQREDLDMQQAQSRQQQQQQRNGQTRSPARH